MIHNSEAVVRNSPDWTEILQGAAKFLAARDGNPNRVEPQHVVAAEATLRVLCETKE